METPPDPENQPTTTPEEESTEESSSTETETGQQEQESMTWTSLDDHQQYEQRDIDVPFETDQPGPSGLQSQPHQQQPSQPVHTGQIRGPEPSRQASSQQPMDQSGEYQAQVRNRPQQQQVQSQHQHYQPSDQPQQYQSKLQQYLSQPPLHQTSQYRARDQPQVQSQLQAHLQSQQAPQTHSQQTQQQSQQAPRLQPQPTPQLQSQSMPQPQAQSILQPQAQSMPQPYQTEYTPRPPPHPMSQPQMSMQSQPMVGPQQYYQSPSPFQAPQAPSYAPHSSSHGSHDLHQSHYASPRSEYQEPAYAQPSTSHQIQTNVPAYPQQSPGHIQYPSYPQHLQQPMPSTSYSQGPYTPQPGYSEHYHTPHASPQYQHMGPLQISPQQLGQSQHISPAQISPHRMARPRSLQNSPVFPRPTQSPRSKSRQSSPRRYNPLLSSRTVSGPRPVIGPVPGHSSLPAPAMPISAPITVQTPPVPTLIPQLAFYPHLGPTLPPLDARGPEVIHVQRPRRMTRPRNPSSRRIIIQTTPGDYVPLPSMATRRKDQTRASEINLADKIIMDFRMRCFHEGAIWAGITYHELEWRAPEKAFAIEGCNLTVDGYACQGANKLSIGSIPRPVRNETTEKLRRHFYRGFTVSKREGGNIYLRNDSPLSLFVTDPLMNDPEREHIVKIRTGEEAKIFAHETFREKLTDAGQSGFSKVFDLTSKTVIRISVGKMWGKDYRRRTILDLPLWFELTLVGPLQWIDRVLISADPPDDQPCTSQS